MSSGCKKELVPKDYKRVTQYFGMINPGVNCPKCNSYTFKNKANQKWCTTCDWSNDSKLSLSLRRTMN